MYVLAQIFVLFCPLIYPRTSTNVQDRAMVHQYSLSKWKCPVYPLSQDAERPALPSFVLLPFCLLSSAPCAAFPVLHLLVTSNALPVPSLVHFLSFLLHPLPPSVTWSIPIAPFSSHFLFAFTGDRGRSKQKDMTSHSYLMRSLLFLRQRAALLTHPTNEESLSKRLCHVTFRG